MTRCPFCEVSKSDLVLEDTLAVAFFDRYPVNPGHLLIVPRRHVASFFDATPDELESIHALLTTGKELLQARFNPDGFNIGVNIGEAAGQTIFHLHIHLIPRYTGDMPDPRGGVRGVIPEKQKY